MNARILMLLVVFVAGCSPALPLKQIDGKEIADLPIYIVSHDRHTGVVVDREHAGLYLTALDEEFKQSTRYIEVGWGDARYYQAEEKTMKLAAQAILYPTDTVLHVVAVPMDPKKYFLDSQVEKLLVTGTGFQNMMNYIDKTFERDRDGNSIIIDKGLYNHSWFYRAKGKFHAFNTCNTWTAKVLGKAGFPVKTFLTVTAEDLMNQVKDLQKMR